MRPSFLTSPRVARSVRAMGDAERLRREVWFVAIMGVPTCFVGWPTGWAVSPAGLFGAVLEGAGHH